MKERSESDGLIKERIAQTLSAAIDEKDVATVASQLGVSVGTLYKYVAGTMIPGGHVLWRACSHLDLVLDERGLHPVPRRKKRGAAPLPIQYDLPFLSESLASEKVNVDVNRKKDAHYVDIRMRIKVAG